MQTVVDKKDAIVEYVPDESGDSINEDKDYVVTFSDLDSNEGIVQNVLDDTDDPNAAAWTSRTVFRYFYWCLWVCSPGYLFQATGHQRGIFLLMLASILG